MTRDRPTRRGLLASVAVGSALLAGCGYRPGAGEFAWSEPVGRPGLVSPGDERWFTADDRIYRLGNRSGMGYGDSVITERDDAVVTVYDSSGSRVWSGSTEAQYAGEPAVAAGRVFVPLESGAVTALERPETDDETASDRSRDDAVLWTTEWAAAGPDSAAEDGTDADGRPESDTDNRPESDSPADAEPEPDGDADGTAETGTDDTNEEPSVPPLTMAAGPDLAVGFHDGGVVSFDAATGEKRFALAAADLAVATVDDAAVAGDRVWLIATRRDDEPVAISLDRDGHVDATASLHAAPDWLETANGAALLPVGTELRALEPDGDRRFTVRLDGAGEPLLAGGRLYHVSETTGSITAVDLAAGDRAWHRDDLRLEAVAADGDGVYAVGAGPESERDPSPDGCGLFALTAAGNSWWQVPLLEDANCGGDLFAVDDRLVLRDDDLYGFHREPGTRNTLL